MTCRDWRGVPAAVVAPLYKAEIARWSSLLHWDTRSTWRQVEIARRLGTLPGFIAEDAARVTGWTLQMPHRGCLQVGAIVAADAGTTEALIDHVCSSEEALAASSALVFAISAAPELARVLEERGFVVERYLHMECALDPERAAGAEAALGRAWTSRDRQPVTDLMAAAYESSSPARPFARSGEPDAWAEYVAQLTDTTGCGVFMPHLSVIVSSAHTGAAQAAVLTTAVGVGTGHLAQVVVAPGSSGTGLGRRAVTKAMANLRDAGFARVTLLVGERNHVAERLYRSLGFVETAWFVSASLAQPSRSTIDALATAGASTLR